MSKPVPTSRTIHFENFEFDCRSSELREQGRKVKVQGQPVQILAMLLEQPGELVTREELKNKLWPGDTFVDFEHSLNAAVKRLRQALHDSAENPRRVETLARRGDRFIAEVGDVEGARLNIREPATDNVLTAEDREQPEVAEETAVVNHLPWPLAWKISGLALLVISTIVVVWILRFRSVPSPTIRSLAVLPLESLSSDSSQEYFADGMTDELISDLGQISALRVISRTSVMQYKGVRKPLPQIARELNVDAVVEGTVLHSGKQVRITAQLIRAPADKHLWAQSYEGDVSDTLALQKKVARAIVEQIRVKLTPQEDAVLENVKVVNPEAYENYLKGRYFWNKRTADGLKKASYYLNRAIEGDPNYSLPYTGLADIHQLSDHPQLAREEVQKALDLDDQLPEAHNSLARLLYLFNRDWEGAAREFKRALELDHNYAPAHHWYSMYLALEGRKEQALAEAEKASELDPLSPVVGANLAKILQEVGQNDKAIEQAKKTLDLDPDSGVTHAVLGIVYQDQQMY